MWARRHRANPVAARAPGKKRPLNAPKNLSSVGVEEPAQMSSSSLAMVQNGVAKCHFIVRCLSLIDSFHEGPTSENRSNSE
ncbi:hypothetical protein TNCV_1715401 [Trichonephila clavipes]|nr:hypothetical protein TNCV_1715401 [Trichonephila clavipes]